MKPPFPADVGSDARSRSGSARRALWTMLPHACRAAAVAHFVFLLLFAHLGLVLLVWVNIASVALFIGSGALLARRRNLLAMALIFGELLMHAAVSSALLGWESGFHYYLLTVVGPLMFGMNATTIGRPLARLLVFGAVYAALDAWTRRMPPVYRLDPVLLDTIRYLNLAGMLSIMAYVSLVYSRLMLSAERDLQALASTDPLTGLPNRRHLLEIVHTLRRTDPAAPGPCILLCDVDHFKQVNDRHGHETGDLVLQHVASAVTAAVRTTETVARWGGEEFVVLLPDADLARALETGERIRGAVAALTLCRPGRPSPAADPPLPIPVTITIGVARVDPADSVDAALARADAALYRGKAAGRDRVVADDDVSAPPLARAA